MGDLFPLSKRQMARISPFFPLSRGVPRSSGIVYVIRNDLQWKDAPAGYGPHKTLYNRFIRWSRLGVFDWIFAGLTGGRPRPERIMIDATHLKARRTAASLLKKGMFPIGRDRGDNNLRVQPLCSQAGVSAGSELLDGCNVEIVPPLDNLVTFDLENAHDHHASDFAAVGTLEPVEPFGQNARSVGGNREHVDMDRRDAHRRFQPVDHGDSLFGARRN
ncbi:Transposase IS4-like domain-containing protein [Rhizobium leguminosarum bv. trifolii]